MCYRGGRGVVTPDESTSIRNCGDAYDGIRPGRMIVKYRWWPRDMASQMCLWHIVMAEPLHKRHPLLRQMALGIVNVIQAWSTAEIHDMAGKHWLDTTSFVVR